MGGFGSFVGFGARMIFPGPMSMADPHVATALVKKRAELSGDIEATQAKLRQMILDLESLDKTLLMFHPDYKIECIKPKAEDRSKRGEMSRIIPGYCGNQRNR
ncbi:MAG: hypothetical protein WC026_06975 [Hyphomicrobium sp.]|uniref:hypothetical protein n=1 Tax=Hyphomicrobium sp. TaxID=82 RepID=UPI00356A3C52